MSVNKAILVGNLGKDPEMKTSAGGSAIARFSLATSHREKKGEEWVQATEWHRVVCFGRTAEAVGKFCQKGKTVFVEGRIKTNKWTDKDGQTRYTTEILADEVKFLGGRSEGGGGGGREPGDDSHEGGGPDEDIPF